MTLRELAVEVSLLFQASAVEAREKGMDVSQDVTGAAEPFDHLSTASTIGNLVAHPAEAGNQWQLSGSPNWKRTVR
jgi:hypothetical protein